MVAGELLGWTPPPPKQPPPPKSTAISWNLAFFGGDSGSPNLMMTMGYMQVNYQGQGNPAAAVQVTNAFYTPQNIVSPSAALLAALQIAGPGKTIVGVNWSQFMRSELAILFDKSVNPRAWYASSINTQPSTFIPATGLPAGDGIGMAGGPDISDALAILAGPASRYSSDGIAFGNAGTPPSQINRILQEQGQNGVYLGAAASGIVKSIDSGANWGYVRPHATLGTAWPAGAVGRDICIYPAARPQLASAPLIVLGTNLYRLLGDGNAWSSIDGTPPATSGLLLRYYGGGKLVHRDRTTGGSTIRYSGDSGATWATRAIPSPISQIQSFDLAPSGRLWIVGEQSITTGHIYYSDDNGATWNASTSWAANLGVGHIAVNQANSNQIAASYLSGGSGDIAVRVSQNGGASWTNHTIGGNTFIASAASGRIHWLGSRMVIIYELTNSHVHIQYSDDFGATWHSALDVSVGSSAPRVMDFIAGSALGPMFGAITKLATNVTGCMLRSTDHGQTWDQLDSPFGANELRSLAYDPLTDRLFALDDSSNVKVLAASSTVTAADWLASWVTLGSDGVASPAQGMAMVAAIN